MKDFGRMMFLKAKGHILWWMGASGKVHSPREKQWGKEDSQVLVARLLKGRSLIRLA